MGPVSAPSPDQTKGPGPSDTGVSQKNIAREESLHMWSQWALLTDLYQLTMVGGYVQEGKEDQWANFDYFFRKIPDDGGYCVLAPTIGR